MTVTTPSSDVALPVAGLVEVSGLAAAWQGPVLYAPLDTVADLFGLRDIDTTRIFLSAGALYIMDKKPRAIPRKGSWLLARPS